MDKEKSPDWLIDNIAEASKNARGIYLLFIGFLAYCSLTLFSTTDRQIILNETARLPIINIDISLLSFFIVTPLLAILIFIYLQLYLLRINDLVNDFLGNKKRLYPWMLNIAKDPKPGLTGGIQKFIVNFSLWWLLPIVLILFPLEFIKKHDELLSIIIGSIPLIGTFVVIWFWCQYEGVKLRRVIFNNPGKLILSIIVLLFTIFYIFLLIPWALNGRMSGFLSKFLYVDLSYQKLVQEQNEDYETLYWVNLEGANLAGGNFTGSILKRANLSRSNLKVTKFDNANLVGANLDSSQLQSATLKFADIQGGSFYKAQLNNADLEGADLNNAILYFAQLQHTDLSRAKLQNANFVAAKLQKASLFGAKLQNANLKYAKLQYAILTYTQLQNAFLGLAKLNGARLFYTNLDSADLSNADLDSTDFSVVHLNNTNLGYVKLRSVHGLYWRDLLRVKTLYKAKLDSSLFESIKRRRPDLFERPKGQTKK